MVFETISAGAVGILASYLPKVGEGAAKKMGENLVGAGSSLLEGIKAKFKGDADAEQTLALMEAKPNSGGRQASLGEVLVDKMAGDEHFALLLRDLVSAAKAQDNRQLAAGHRNVVIDGGNSGIINTGDRVSIKK